MNIVDHHSLFLTSNANLSISSENSLSKFTNHLPFPLECMNYGEIWKIGVQSLFVDLHFVDGEKPSLLLVQCDQVEPCVGSSKFTSTIVFQASLEKMRRDEDTYTFSAKNITYMNALSTCLTAFKITLCDEHGKQLLLSSNQPTIVQLSLLKMQQLQMSSFIVRVSSQDSLKAHPENRKSNFRTELTQRLQLPIDIWKVALSSLTLPLLFDLWSGKEITIVIKNAGKTYGIRIDGIKSTKVTNSNELIIVLNKLMNKYGQGLVSLSLTSREETVVLIKGKNVQFHVPHVLRRMFGFTSTEQGEETEQHWILTSKRKNHQFQSTQPINLYCEIPHSILVYGDFIKSNIVGSVETKLLKVVHLPQTLYRRHHGKTLGHSDLSTLQISLHMINGEEIHFLNTDNSVHATFIFTKDK